MSTQTCSQSGIVEAGTKALLANVSGKQDDEAEQHHLHSGARRRGRRPWRALHEKHRAERHEQAEGGEHGKREVPTRNPIAIPTASRIAIDQAWRTSRHDLPGERRRPGDRQAAEPVEDPLGQIGD
jgi:hypothetical protein